MLDKKDTILNELHETIKNQPERSPTSYLAKTTPPPAQPVRTHTKTRAKTKEPARSHIRKSEQGVYRMINPEILFRLCQGGFTSSEHQVINYILWNITADKKRSFINVKRKTIQDRTGLSKSQVHKVIHSLLKRNIIIDSSSELRQCYSFNSDYEQWL